MKFDTIAVQGGMKPGDNRACISPPIYQNTAFYFKDLDFAAGLFDLAVPGDIYTRLSNPTTSMLEERVAALEGGVGAVAVSSGMSASLLSILNLTNAGNEVVASASVYGGTFNLLNSTLPKYGVVTKFVNSDKIEDYEKQINDKTRCIYAETVGNPVLDVCDIEGLAKLAHKYSIPLIIDNTVPSPYLCRPFEYGADIVIHALTKYISGHGNSMGGIIVDSGKFDWKKSGKFPDLTQNDPSYHGLSYTETFKEAAYITRIRTALLRDLGCCLSPFNSYLTLVGLETLHLRMVRHSESALKIAKWLKNSEYVKWVNYPLLEESKYYEKAKKYLPKGASSIVAFGLKGDRKNLEKFVSELKLFIHATNIGDSRSIVTCPSLTTHRQLSDEELQKAGIGIEFVRLSVGLEDSEDLISDLEHAFKKSV